MSALFFTESWMKENTPLGQNVDYQDIKPFIEPAGDMYIKPEIGKSLYDRLKQSIIDNDYNSDELILLNLIRPAVCYYTLYMAMPFIQTKIRNAGLVKNADTTIQTISRQDMLDLRQETLNLASFYLGKITEWMCLYSSKYPQYSNPDPLNDKSILDNTDYAGFQPYKTALGLGTDRDLILKTIGYKNIK